MINISWKRNSKRLSDILSLEYDWNDHRAESFGVEHIGYIKDIIDGLEENNQPEIFPTAADSVHLEWDRGNNVFIIDVKKDKHITMFQRIGKESKEIQTSLFEALIELGKYLEKCK